MRGPREADLPSHHPLAPLPRLPASGPGAGVAKSREGRSPKMALQSCPTEWMVATFCVAPSNTSTTGHVWLPSP